VATGTTVVDSSLSPMSPSTTAATPGGAVAVLDAIPSILYATSHGCRGACDGGGEWKRMGVCKKMATGGQLKRKGIKC
jgi:hypothetical protein